MDLREKIVAAHIEEKISIRQVAIRFAVSKSLLQKLVTMNNSMDSKAFEVFLEKFLVPQLWTGAVVIIDNLPFG